jgi:hypothetical protein
MKAPAAKPGSTADRLAATGDALEVSEAGTTRTGLGDCFNRSLHHCFLIRH